ncbi:hypothetical protein SS50377_27607 [Spironucleus salmonicida]|uniref:Uncharacterized protein n=1 Tax=Spironucleus salmonicida TaxID=348837 RepID=V6LPT4_9EUKA|nr:hypothetical protein SS50377_27607 [Spironucleus salmonicida]|eukprot:EST46615.1 Hypothetical protein SS50377_13419 [Spironucleus salmonicida]
MGNQASATTGLRNYKEVDQNVMKLENQMQQLQIQYKLEISFTELMLLVGINYKRLKFEEKDMKQLEKRISQCPIEKDKFIFSFIADGKKKIPVNLVMKTALVLYNLEIDQIYITMMFGETELLSLDQIKQIQNAYTTGFF